MLGLLKIEQKREVRHHEHGQDIHDNDATRQRDANGLDGRHRCKNKRHEADHGGHGRQEDGPTGGRHGRTNLLLLRPCLLRVTVGDVKTVRNTKREQNRPDNNDGHGHLKIRPT